MMKWSDRRLERRRWAQQFREDLDRLGPGDRGTFTGQFVVRLLPTQLALVAMSLSLVIAVVNALVRWRRGARYLLTSKPTVVFLALLVPGFVGSSLLRRWVRQQAEEIHQQGEPEPPPFA